MFDNGSGDYMSDNWICYERFIEFIRYNGKERKRKYGTANKENRKRIEV